MFATKTRRNLSPEFKFKVVLEILSEERRQSEIARSYDLHPSVVANWKREFLRKGPEVFKPHRDNQKNKKRIKQLEETIDRQTVEIQLLKKILDQLG